MDVPKVFLNAAKGTPAQKKDLNVFVDDDDKPLKEEECVCRIIMEGQLQVCFLSQPWVASPFFVITHPRLLAWPARIAHNGGVSIILTIATALLHVP